MKKSSDKKEMTHTESNAEINAIAILKKDHETLKDLFKKFEGSDTLTKKKKIVIESLKELKIHAEVEEKIFYPAVRKAVDKDIMNEADEEHHVAKVLIAELEEMDGSESHYCAKFTVLAENVRHHIKEEEGEMMPKTKSANIDMEMLGKTILASKKQLAKNGIAVCAEEKMVAMMKGKGDSPAASANAMKS